MSEYLAVTKPRKRRRIFIWSVVLLPIVGVFLIPAIISARTCMLMSACKHNLSQINLALWEYHDDYGSFPPTYIADENGRPMHSWRVLLLPYLDEQELYEQYRFDEPWDGPNNSKLADQMPEMFRCPGFKHFCKKNGASKELRCLTSYVSLNHPQSVFPGEQAIGGDDIPDGTSNTILLVETRQHAVHWMQPVGITLPEFLADLEWSKQKTHSNHGDAAMLHISLADGSVRGLWPDSESFSLKLIRALATRNGGEVLNPW